ncbi:MAG: esterase/lipase family protein [Chthoniobacterales bacterium]
MKPIVLIHGYSSESPTPDPASIENIYGDLPQRLRASYDVVEVDLSRYVSLNDSVSVADIARALHRALLEQHPALLESGFHVVIHSTGALVIRTWIRLFSPQPSPVRNLIYLAGANLGSGWASIGQGQVARWGRFVFERGAQRGVKVLQSLELGSSPTIDLHLFFTRPGSRMLEDYKVQEFIIIGTQADPSWFEFPIRYAHEDGSDGVVRVAAGNLNFNHLVIGPDDKAALLPWPAIRAAAQAAVAKADFPEYYEVKEHSCAGEDRQAVPCGIPYSCAHSGDQMGIVYGTIPRDQVARMLKLALETPEATMAAYQSAVAAFDQETALTFQTAKTMQKPGLFNFLDDPRNQYDPHAQVVFRLWDQDGSPIPIGSSDIFFVSQQGGKGTLPVQSIIENSVVSGVAPNVIVFYLRVQRFDRGAKDWVDQLANVSDFALEITAIEPAAPTDNPLISYLPLRMPLSAEELEVLIQPHRTTIIDVTLLRLPSPDLYQLIKS